MHTHRHNCSCTSSHAHTLTLTKSHQHKHPTLLVHFQSESVSLSPVVPVTHDCCTPCNSFTVSCVPQSPPRSPGQSSPLSSEGGHMSDSESALSSDCGHMSDSESALSSDCGHMSDAESALSSDCGHMSDSESALSADCGHMSDSESAGEQTEQQFLQSYWSTNNQSVLFLQVSRFVWILQNYDTDCKSNDTLPATSIHPSIQCLWCLLLASSVMVPTCIGVWQPHCVCLCVCVGLSLCIFLSLCLSVSLSLSLCPFLPLSL
jgi:hypothetical protein